MPKVEKAVGVYDKPAARGFRRRPVLYTVALVAAASAIAAVVVLT